MELPDRVDAKRWEGLEVVDRDDQGLGTCVGVFADADTDLTEWLLVDVPGHRRALVPALDALDAGGGVRVPFAREQVVTAPPVGDETQLSKDDEKVLYDHYGVSYSDDDSTSLLPEGAVELDAGTPPPTASVDPAPQPVAVVAPEPAPVTLEVPMATPSVHDAGPVPTAASSDRDQGVSPVTAGAPLISVGGLAAAVWLVLRVRDRRASRRRQVSARTRRAHRQVSSGSSQAAERVGRHLAGLSAVAGEATKQATKQASAGASRSSQAAADLRREAAKAAAQRRKEAAKAVAQHRKEARSGLTAATGAVTDTRDTAAKRIRKTRRRIVRRLLGTGTALAAGGGYVLGARAGHERYDQIRAAAAGLTGQTQERPTGDTAGGQQRRVEAVTGLRTPASEAGVGIAPPPR